MANTFLFAGSWQIPCYGLTCDGDGIHMYRVSEQDGTLTHTDHYKTSANTSILALSPNGSNLYATDERRNHNGIEAAGGGVLAFSIDPVAERLVFINSGRTFAPFTSYVDVHQSEKLLAFSNHGSTMVGEYQVAFRQKSDGTYETFRVTDRVSVGVYALDGCGGISGNPDIHPLDANGAHFHCAKFSPSGKWLLAADKGTDKICVYRTDSTRGRIYPNDPPYFRCAPSTAPRHIAFLSGTPYFFVCNEIGFTVSSYQLDEATGVIWELDNKSTLPSPMDSSLGGVADIRIQGRFLYVSNRFRESDVSPSYIAVYEISADGGKLREVEYYALTGNNPRGFNFSPDGRFLYTGDLNSGTITRYLVSRDTGRLSDPMIVAEMGSPSCIQLAKI